MNDLVRVNTEDAEPALPAELVARASDYIREAKSEKTRTAYALAWRQFSAWCEAHGRCALPCSPETLAAWLVALAEGAGGFRYFDARDLLGFVDGTANPTGLDLPASALVGDEDGDFAGGSYVVIQKYLHDLGAWAKVPTHLQEEIIGRTKIDNIEIDDDDAPRKSHKSLATIVDARGHEYDILRDNMPFGRPGQREFGTYFIGYSRYLWVIEKMLQRMYIGDPPGAYDRLLDFSTPHTGATFFAPARPALEALVQAAEEKLAAA
jgi:porphyrinogen peroxidase